MYKTKIDQLENMLTNLSMMKGKTIMEQQQEIVNLARKLESEGKIIITRGGSEDAMV
jgi:flagellar motor switch protein FliG